MPAAKSTVDRLKLDVGALLDTHDGGMSFDELHRYRGRFVDFCSDLFDLELTPQQAEGADALDQHRQVLIQGGNGVGKDTLVAARALFEIYVMDGLTILTGPSERQVREVTMRREIGRLWRLASGKLPGERFEMAVRIPGKEEGGLLAFTASDPERFVGHHSSLGRVFIAVTEGQGIEPEIFEAIQRCQPTLLLVVCNTSSPGCEAHRFSESSTWHALRWSCLDHPNVTTGETVIPGAVTKDWVNAVRQEYGEGSRFWTYAVEALWPTDAEESLFLTSWVMESVERWESGELEEVA